MNREEKLQTMRSKRPQPPGPLPERRDFEDDDSWRAKLFGWWLKSHGLTVDGTAAAAGVSRASLISLSGAAGKAVTSRWSRITRSQLLAIHEALNVAEPLTLSDLRDFLRLPADHDPQTWAETPALSGQARLNINDVPLLARWDVRDQRGPHVWSDDGGLEIGPEVPTGCARYGRLISLTPVD